MNKPVVNARLLEPVNIPVSLSGSKAETLILPESLTTIYRQLLKKRHLDLAALGHAGENPVLGHKSASRTIDQALACQFQAAAGRAQLCLLDPENCLGPTSNQLLQAFTQGQVAVLDLPCGCGAASWGLLTTFSELRATGLLPRLPLEIFITGGDNSPEGRVLASQFLDLLSTRLADQAIRVQGSFLRWDLLDAQSTTTLLDRWLKTTAHCRSRVLVLSGLSEVLSTAAQCQQAKPQLQEILRWAHRQHTQVLWMEPDTRTSNPTFFSELGSLWSKQWVGRPTWLRHDLDPLGQTRLQVVLLATNDTSDS